MLNWKNFMIIARIHLFKTIVSFHLSLSAMDKTVRSNTERKLTVRDCTITKSLSLRPQSNRDCLISAFELYRNLYSQKCFIHYTTEGCFKNQTRAYLLLLRELFCVMNQWKDFFLACDFISDVSMRRSHSMHLAYLFYSSLKGIEWRGDNNYAFFRY